MVKIKKIDPLQAAQVVAAIYFFVFLIIFIPLGLLGVLVNSPMLGIGDYEGVILFIMPFVYAFLSFIFTAIFCVIYNLISGWLGGIAIEIEAEDLKGPASVDNEDNLI